MLIREIKVIIDDKIKTKYFEYYNFESVIFQKNNFDLNFHLILSLNF